MFLFQKNLLTRIHVTMKTATKIDMDAALHSKSALREARWLF